MDHLAPIAAVVLTLTLARAAPPMCPGGTIQVDGPFRLTQDQSVVWIACEDLTLPDGALVLVPSTGEPEWFAKGYAPYAAHPESYYYDDLNVSFTTTGPDQRHPLPPRFTYGKAAVIASGGLGNYLSAGLDILGIALLNETELTWAKVISYC